MFPQTSLAPIRTHLNSTQASIHHSIINMRATALFTLLLAMVSASLAAEQSDRASYRRVTELDAFRYDHSDHITTRFAEYDAPDWYVPPCPFPRIYSRLTSTLLPQFRPIWHRRETQKLYGLQSCWRIVL